MKSKKFTALALIAALSVSACTTSPYGQQRANTGGMGIGKTEVGTLLGGAAGALAGAQFGKGRGKIASVALGTLLGAAVGHEAGASMDRADMNYFEQDAQRSLEYAPTGQTSTWNNPDSGNNGAFTPTKTYMGYDGRYCREFNHTIEVGGKWQNGYGTACRQPDGSWEIVS
jgi:surface antigen